MVKRVKQNFLKQEMILANETNAIVIIGYNRPEMLNQRLLDLINLTNRSIYISIDFESDGTVEKTKQIISNGISGLSEKNKVSVEYQERNLGLTEHVTSVITFALQQHSNVIVVEDDIQLNEHTIHSLDFGLKLMHQDATIGSVGAFSPINLPKFLQGKNSFHKSKYFACWGWATTREKWQHYRTDLSEVDLDNTLFNSSIWKHLSKNSRLTWMGRFNKIRQNPSHTWDIQFQFISFKNDWNHLVPYGSLVGNVGFSDSRSAHTKGPKPKWMRTSKIPDQPSLRLSKNPLLKALFEFMSSVTFIGDNESIMKFLTKLRRLLRPEVRSESNLD